ncbi:MAG: suppressor of fused domain protein [Myxococcota bacterium]
MSDDELEAPGWDAILGALQGIYGGREPDAHYGTLIPYALGGPDPLRGISVYRTDAFGRPQWHYVTFGFTDLYEKEGDDPAVSGYGFELSLRLARGDEAEPPQWPLGVLQSLGRYVFQTGNRFGRGDHASFPFGDGERAFDGAGFGTDRELPAAVDSPNGRFLFLALVGLYEDELDALRSWNGDKALAVIDSLDPGLVTTLGRASWASNPRFAAAVAEGVAQDGSSMGHLPFPELRVSGRTLTMPAFRRDLFLQALRNRLPHGRRLDVWADEDRLVRFEPGPAWAVQEEDSLLVVAVPPDMDALAAAVDGAAPIDGLSFVLEPD